MPPSLRSHIQDYILICSHMAKLASLQPPPPPKYIMFLLCLYCHTFAQFLEILHMDYLKRTKWVLYIIFTIHNILNLYQCCCPQVGQNIRLVCQTSATSNGVVYTYQNFTNASQKKMSNYQILPYLSIVVEEKPSLSMIKLLYRNNEYFKDIFEIKQIFKDIPKFV